MNCRRSVFIHNKGQWIKNNSVNQFDISMGLLDSAESSNLVGLFIFYNLTTYDDININSIVLYRDDDLMLVKNSTKVKADKIRKLIHREFKSFNHKVKINTNLKIVDFIDVTLALVNNVFQPYMKTNANPIYIHPNSNHPPSDIYLLLYSIGLAITRLVKMSFTSIVKFTILP